MLPTCAWVKSTRLFLLCVRGNCIAAAAAATDAADEAAAAAAAAALSLLPPPAPEVAAADAAPPIWWAWWWLIAPAPPRMIVETARGGRERAYRGNRLSRRDSRLETTMRKKDFIHMLYLLYY